MPKTCGHALRDQRLDERLRRGHAIAALNGDASCVAGIGHELVLSPASARERELAFVALSRRSSHNPWVARKSLPPDDRSGPERLREDRVATACYDHSSSGAGATSGSSWSANTRVRERRERRQFIIESRCGRLSVTPSPRPSPDVISCGPGKYRPHSFLSRLSFVEVASPFVASPVHRAHRRARGE